MTPEEAKRLAANLQAQRIAKGLSAHEVARRAGVNVGTVTRIELGQIGSPRPENLIAIAAVLDIQVADIFATANWVEKDQLPSFAPYMRAKYRDLPEEALQELKTFFNETARRYGTAGPANGADEY